jgi:hypothetical protein
MADVTFTPNLQPAPACYPSDVNGLLTLITTGGGISGTIPDNAGGGIYVGSVAPSSSLTNKVWFQIDAAGRPLGVYMFYNGNWRLVYTGRPTEIKMFNGNWTLYFDGTGLGIVGGTWDGWALCNGNNGTQNMIDNFVIAGSEYVDEWLTGVNGPLQNAGGQQGPWTLAASQMPELSVDAWGWFRPPLPEAGQPGLFIAPSGVSGAGVIGEWLINETAGSPNNPLPFPPFIALGFAAFVGYR